MSKNAEEQEFVDLSILDEDVKVRRKKCRKFGCMKKNDKPEPDAVAFFQLFKYASKCDVLFMSIGLLASLINGAIMPLLMLVFTNIIDTFTYSGKACNLNYTSFMLNQSNVSIDYSGAAVIDSLTSQLRDQIIYLIALGIASMILMYFQVTFWLIPAQKQAFTIRNKLFSAILNQDIGWFDMYKSGELTTRLSDDVNKIKDGIGDKLGNAIQYVGTFLCGFIIGFIKGWKLTLVILSLSPLLFVSASLFTKLTESLTSNELKSYAKAGAIAEEVISSIRTVFAFNGVKKDHKRYETRLEEARLFGIKKSLINGFNMGFLILVINCAYALGFWYGWTLTVNKDPITGEYEYTIGKILFVFFNIIIGVFSLGNAGPFMGTLATARSAAFEVFKIIERKPTIDSSSKQGIRPVELLGEIEFEKVSFNYPSRPDVSVLNGVSYKINPGQTVALVGSSGCGKSTCLQLIQRFYDPLDGAIKIDNKNLQDYNIKWLRTHIGVVNQEPILFGTTIKENIKFGKDSATDEEIIQAARNANAHDFIMTLPDKYETLVGDRGSQLSGGQKQRIAIARALIRNPKVLLLDEATSALDNESESIVQAALERASHGRTTIIVAHRLSTIINADLIFVFDQGIVVETGTHTQLMEAKGVYYNLVITQQNAMNLDQNNNLPQDDKPPFDLKKQESKDHKLIVETLDKTNGKDAPDDEKNKPKVKDPPFMRVLGLNRPEWYFILIGCLASIVSGALQPLFAIVFSKAIAVFQLCDMVRQKELIILYSILFIIFGVVTFFSNILQSSMFGFSGENLTKRLRSQGFRCILTQEVGWFDQPDNNVGKLCTKLAIEAAAVQGATGIRIGTMLMNVANLGIGIVIAFVYGWAITLVILAFIPFIVLSGILQTKMLAGFSTQDKENLQDAGKISIEAISNIRTVSIFIKEDYFSNAYRQKLMIPYKASIKSTNIFGFMLGFSTSIIYYAIAAAFAMGAYLIEKQLFGMTFENVMLVFNSIIFGAQSVGQASSLLPDYAKAKAAIVSIFELFDRVPLINNWESTEGGSKLNENLYRKNISLDAIEFAYPARPDAKILKGINLTIKEGQRVAFVGSSGCGKSTITQLIERFYDPDEGQVKLDDKNLKELNLHWLRSQVGIVSQEPILFDMSIAENIAYGDNSRQVEIEEIIEASKQANIYDFISKLPQGFDTNVGSKGTQLSGGQKQRIAIARALVRNPKILLLDEATSALDTESEKIVQEALDRAQQGRTCIIIAHRLSTIRNCDLIFVLQNGVVTEVGTHDELIRLNGFYAKLNRQ